MIAVALLATWWAGLGVVVGLNRAWNFPGPADAIRWAALWACAWPVLWALEEPRGR